MAGSNHKVYGSLGVQGFLLRLASGLYSSPVTPENAVCGENGKPNPVLVPFEKAVKALDMDVTPAYLYFRFQQAEPERLRPDLWKTLQNSDSFEVSEEQEVRDLLTEEADCPVDFDSVKAEIAGGAWVPPLILQPADGLVKPYLVDGDHRLMVAKVLGVATPMVRIVTL